MLIVVAMAGAILLGLYRLAHLLWRALRDREVGYIDDWLSVPCLHGNHGACAVPAGDTCLCPCHDSKLSTREVQTRQNVRSHFVKGPPE